MKPGSTSPDVLADPDDDALGEADSVLSRREVRISLGVIGALLIVLGVLVARRWNASEDSVAKNPKQEGKTAANEKSSAAPSAVGDATTPARAEELPPVALRPVEGAEPPFDDPQPAPTPAADPFAMQESAAVTQDASQEIGQATLAPEETATDEGFPDAADSGIAGISPPLPTGDDSLAADSAPPSVSGTAPQNAALAFPEPPGEEPSFETATPGLEASGATDSEASPPLAFDPPAPSNEGETSANPLRAPESSLEPPLDEATPPTTDGFDSVPPVNPDEPAGFGATAGTEPPPAVGDPTFAPDGSNADGTVEHTLDAPPSEVAPLPADEAPNPLRNASPHVAPAPLSQPPTASTAEQYRTVSGDTFWSISKRAYGTGAYYQALAEFNRGIVPAGQSPAAGQTLLIPTAHELEQRYPQLCPTVAEIRHPGGAPATPREPTQPPPSGMPAGLPQSTTATPLNTTHAAPSARVLPRGQRSYRVRPGETLYDIAQQQLGSPLRWTDIYKLNKQALGDRPHDLRPDMELILPSSEDRSAANPRIRP